MSFWFTTRHQGYPIFPNSHQFSSPRFRLYSRCYLRCFDIGPWKTSRAKRKHAFLVLLPNSSVRLPRETWNVREFPNRKEQAESRSFSREWNEFSSYESRSLISLERKVDVDDSLAPLYQFLRAVFPPFLRVRERSRDERNFGASFPLILPSSERIFQLRAALLLPRREENRTWTIGRSSG